MITIAGCGPGDPDLIPPAVRTAVRTARLLAGAPRLLACFPEATAERLAYRGDTEALLAALAAGPRPACVLVSGDPGLASLAQPVLARFGRAACRVIPGISSVQAACAAAGLSWLGAVTLSCHGGAPPAVDAAWLRRAPLIAVLAGDAAALAWCAALQRQLGDDRRLLLCERLSLPGERVRELDADALAAAEADPLSIVLLAARHG